MHFSLRHGPLCLLLGIIHGCYFCEGSGFEPRAVSSFKNATSSSSSSSSVKPFLEQALITPTATLLSSSTPTNYSSTITPAPLFPWGDQSIPINTCSVTADDGEIQWTPCNVFAGTVQMSYFPENKGNITYPSEFYNTDMSITMTSPSVYMMVNTLTGDNACGPLGPTYSNKVISMDLTDVFTLQPYADHTVQTRMGPPQVLTLSDLTSNCLNTYGTFSTNGAFLNTHPVYGNYNRCRPRFVFPIELKRVGYPYWMHCGNDDYVFGIFDPPGAVPPVTALLPPPVAAPVTSTFEQASALPTPVSDQASSTSIPDPEPTTSPPEVALQSVIQQDPSTPAALPTGPDPSAPVDPTTNANPPASSTPPSAVITTPSIIIPTSATAIATVGSNTISAIPGSSGVVLPNGSTASVGAVATVTDANSKPVEVSVGSSGIFIVGSGTSRTFVANPTIAPIAIATVASHVVSAAPGATSIVVGSQTAFLGGAAITVSDSVVQLTPSGVEVHDSAGGPATTFAIPTLATPHNVAAPTPIATVGGQIISAAPGDSTLVINGQVLTAGGPPVTLAGSNNVASLDSNGLIIQYPSGAVSSFALPTPPPTPGAIFGTVAGIVVSASSGASVLVIGSQTASIGGPVITLSNNDVVSLGPNGLAIQIPGGSVSTISGAVAVGSSTAAGVEASASSISSSKAIASIIASIAGASTQTTESSQTSQTSQATGSSSLALPTEITTSAGRKIWVESRWAWITFGVSVMLGIVV